MLKNNILRSKKNRIELIPLIDWHFGSKECNEKLIFKTIKYIQDKQDCFAYIGGDLLECATYGSLGLVHQQKHQINNQIESISNLLEPIKDKILFTINANHEFRIEKSTGINLLKLVSDKLDVPFMGWEYNWLVKFKNNSICRVYCHHGSGGGMSSGAKINSCERFHFRSPLAHLIITGHHHFPANTEKLIRYLDNDGSTKEYSQFYVSCGSSHSSDGYAAQKGFIPIQTVTKGMIIQNLNQEIVVDNFTIR